MATNRMLERYRKEVVPALMEEFGYHSLMQVPRDHQSRRQHRRR